MKYVALRMLTGDRGKCLGLIFAIAFSAFLLSHQVSMFFGILERTTSQIIDVVDADIWVMDAHSEYIDEIEGLTESALNRIRSVPGVKWAVRMFKGYATAKASNGIFRQTILLGLDDVSLVGAPRKMILGSYENLRKPNSVIIDEAGFRFFFPGEPLGLGKILEMNDRRAEVVGISDASPPFQTFPVVFSRYTSAVRYVGQVRKQMSFIMCKAESALPIETLCKRINQTTKLKALTTDALPGRRLNTTSSTLVFRLTSGL
jgi:putative ABC transport system permease protein